ncbi:unnamed protein product [Cladocopium goreaui]|uniref:Chaperone protein DnaJ n=1 Tax=Cladocopium goreaui TaxID=2562237 RepID=A0A9P1GM16_9DINO|nr:unnamed protein product [Cladocopium goreaui]
MGASCLQENSEESTSAQIQLLAALWAAPGGGRSRGETRVVGKGDQDKNDIPPFELLHSAEKVLELGGDDPDDTVLVQRSAAARILANKALEGAQKMEGGMIEAGFTLPDVVRFLLLPGAAGRDVQLATSCLKLFEGRSLKEQREVLHTAKGRNSSNTAAAAGTALLKTLSGGVAPTEHVAAPDVHVDSVREVADCGVRLPAAAALLRRMAPSASPLKLAEALLVMAARAGPGQADDIVAISETLASKEAFQNFPIQLILDIVLASSKDDNLQVLVRPAAAVAATVLTQWPFEEMVKLLLSLARRHALLKEEVDDRLRSAAEKCFTSEQFQLLGPNDLAGMVLATLGHGWSRLHEVAGQELLRRLPHFPAKELLMVSPVLFQKHAAQLIGAWPKVLAGGAPKDPKAADGLLPDQLVQLARLVGDQSESEAPDAKQKLMEDLCERLLPKVTELSANGRAQLSQLCKTEGSLPVLGYIRSATAVTGDVVKGAGNLTKGGKVGIYATLLQVLNPGLGDLTLLMECCGEANGLADKASYLVNTNQYTSHIEENVKKDFVGEGKCAAPGPLKTLLQQGQEECSYFYSFKNKDYKEYSFSAYCVPNDVISNFADTKGLPMGYTGVNQILNRNAGELVYAAEGYLGFCYDGMKTVNEANNSFKLFKPTYVDIFGQKFDTGYMENVGFPGLGRLNIMDMMQRSVPAPFLGTLFVYKNNFWSKSQSALNITHFDMKQWAAKKAASQPAAPNTAEYQKEMGQEVGKVADDLAPFQNKNLSPEQQAALTQLMSNKESAALAKNIYAKIEADKKKAAETKAKLDGFIGMMGYTKVTKNHQPTYDVAPPGNNLIEPISDLNMAALLKKKSAPPPTGIDALPKAAAAALPKAAAAALAGATNPAAHPLLQKLMAGGAKGAGATNPAAHPLLQKLMAGGAKGAEAGGGEAAKKDAADGAKDAPVVAAMAGSAPAPVAAPATAPVPHPLLHDMAKDEGNSALKDHPRLKHLLEAFKAKQEGQEKHNKAMDLQDLLKQADATSPVSAKHPRLKALVEEAEHMKETVV